MGQKNSLAVIQRWLLKKEACNEQRERERGGGGGEGGGKNGSLEGVFK